MRTIIRIAHNSDNPFLTLAKRTIADPCLSWESLGFLAFLLAKPDDWRIRPEQLAEERKVHPATIYRQLKKLMEAGYIKRLRMKRTISGRFEEACVYIVHESRDGARLDETPF